MNLPEIAGCGVFDSRIALGGKSVSDVRKVHYFEIEYYGKDGKSSYIDGKEYPIVKGNVIVAKPGQTRYSLLHMRNSYLWLIPDSGEICNLLRSLPDVIPMGDSDDVEKLMAEIRKARQVPFSGSELYTGAKLLELVYHLKVQSERLDRSRVVVSNSSADGIIRASQYIDANYASKITLSDCAKMANLSPVYFHKLFAAIMGKTPHEYLMDKRMSAAMDMLVSTEHELSHIAYECGFGSQSYFNSVFKEKTGLTPRQYRSDKLQEFFADM